MEFYQARKFLPERLRRNWGDSEGKGSSTVRELNGTFASNVTPQVIRNHTYYHQGMHVNIGSIPAEEKGLISSKLMTSLARPLIQTSFSSAEMSSDPCLLATEKRETAAKPRSRSSEKR